MASLTYEIVTPVGRIASGECDMVVAPAVEGEVGILVHHAPYLAALATGVVRIKTGESEERIFVSNGFVEVLLDKVVVLAEVAEKAADIDVERAARAEQAARAKLDEPIGAISAEERLASRRALARAKERQRAARH